MSNVIYVKYGTYVITAKLSMVNTSTPNVPPLIMNGYYATRGDNPTGANRPTISTTSALNPMVEVQGNCRFENFILSTSGGTPAVTGLNYAGESYRGAFAYNIKVSGMSGFGIDCNNGSLLYCEASTCGKGIYGRGFVAYCYAHNNTGVGIGNEDQNNGSPWISCVSESNGGKGFHGASCLGSGYIIECVAYNNTGDGIDSSGSYDGTVMVNNIISQNGGIGIRLKTKRVADPLYNYNCVYGNGTAYSGVIAGANDVTGDPLFTDPANGDFTLQAGSPCLNAAIPMGALVGLTGTY
jgi:hypothetical protein